MLLRIVTNFQFLLLVLLSIALSSYAQDNAQLTIARALRRCYQDRNIFERDNRLPMTPQMLIELIRKVEDHPSFTLDMRQLATSLLFAFKQDGIRPTTTAVVSDDILPFSVSGFNHYKNRVLLTRLITGNANQFPNGTLTDVEHCALHFMLSTSIETHVRGDEGSRCNQLAQLRSSRVPREAGEDTELLKTPEMDKIKKRMHAKFGKYQVEDEEQQEDAPADEEAPQNDEGEALEGDEETVDVGVQQGQVDGTQSPSQCPVENGVIFSTWGSISAGAVMAGIATGLVPQTITVRELITNDHIMEHYKLARQTAGQMTVDNRYAATLSGDVAEAVLRQVPREIQVGASGAWNVTAVPHWYFLSQRDRFEQTDAEIRGGIDGLLMGLRIQEWRNRFTNLRLSQVLDMYYSQRGLFGTTQTPETSIRACNRNEMFSTIPMTTLTQQSIAFTTVLDGEMTSDVTLSVNSTNRIATAATNSLQQYIANSLRDLTCATTTENVGSETIWRTASDIFIFVDTTWAFVEIRAAIGHLLNNLDVGRFGTSYTILNANDGTVIVPTTNQLSDLYTQWTLATHNMQPQGLNLANVVREARSTVESFMNGEREHQSPGGRSLISLVIANQGNVNEADSNFASEQLRIMQEILPDLRWIFWTGGSPNRFERFVREPARDLYQLRIFLQGVGGESIQVNAHPVIHRIQQEPRRIINHRCGSNWQWDNWGDVQMTQYIEPRGIVFYRLHANYFFGGADRQTVRIIGAGYSTLTVCQSRSIERPRENSTNQNQNGEIVCSRINNDVVEIDLRWACDSSGLIQWCPPLFISIEGPAQHDGLQANLRCIDRECRFPDNARFQINSENLGCWSGVGQVAVSLGLILLSIIMTIRV
ncbi:unnamed protein product [Chironomus riparius]|uniref:N-acetylmuramoyl-L-alanine amidase n=1 Tax=Chironomus riparius TaxID=315576 RepID=A0A9N9WNX2_9DIPT|nr:unnamed protein product [Chironomus riparius]